MSILTPALTINMQRELFEVRIVTRNIGNGPGWDIYDRVAICTDKKSAEIIRNTWLSNNLVEVDEKEEFDILVLEVDAVLAEDGCLVWIDIDEPTERAKDHNYEFGYVKGDCAVVYINTKETEE